jgi:oligosaccharide repeat unit polymerase
MFIISTACAAYGVSDWRNINFSFKACALFSLSFTIMVFTEKFIAKHKIVLKKNLDINKIQNIASDELSIKKPWNKILIFIFALLTLLYIYKVYKLGVSLGATSLLSSIGYNKRYGDYDVIARTAFNIVRFSSFIYIVILSNNVIICKRKIRENLDCVFVVLSTAIMAYFSGQRAVAITYIISVVVAVLIAVKSTVKTEIKINVKKIVKKSIVLGIFIILIFYLSHSVVKAGSTKSDFVEYIIYYFGSTTALMGNIVADPSSCHYPFVGYFGEKTFLGFWSTMYSWGVVKEPPAEVKWISLGVINKPTSAGNEFTFFCGPYIDFGFVGTLIFIFLFYAFFSWFYYHKILNVKYDKNKYINLAIYLYLYSMVAMSFYEDTIRSHTRPIILLYIIYMYVFSKIFLKRKVKS